jgi:hypothetical protein
LRIILRWRNIWVDLKRFNAAGKYYRRKVAYQKKIHGRPY